jgi:lysophospholipase L1-like esterase
MGKRINKIGLYLSLVINLFVALPAVILFLGSTGIQFHIYQNILAPRLGKPEIAFLGDSIILGGGIWGLRINEYNFNVWNYGHGGFTTKQLQYYANKLAKRNETRFAFIMAGINDFDKSTAGAENSFENYKVIIETLLAAKIQPIIQLTLYRENEKEIDYVDRLNELLVIYAEKKNIIVIDLNRLLAPGKSLLPQYSKDGVHLTEAAYKIWAGQIINVLKVI